MDLREIKKMKDEQPDRDEPSDWSALSCAGTCLREVVATEAPPRYCWKQADCSAG